jgi:hypothetical protein
MLEQVVEALEGLHAVGACCHHKGLQVGTGLGTNLVVAKHPELSTGVLFDLPLDAEEIARGVAINEQPTAVWVRRSATMIMTWACSYRHG